jgi:hypothetical protein
VSDAPKILWYDDQECSAGPVKFGDSEVKYVRADLVDGLVKALLVARDHIEMYKLEISHGKDAALIRAALAKAGGETTAEIGRGME